MQAVFTTQNKSHLIYLKLQVIKNIFTVIGGLHHSCRLTDKDRLFLLMSRMPIKLEKSNVKILYTLF